jgi:hypothetical protein
MIKDYNFEKMTDSVVIRSEEENINKEIEVEVEVEVRDGEVFLDMNGLHYLTREEAYELGCRLIEQSLKSPIILKVS